MISKKYLISTFIFVSSIQLVMCNGNQEAKGEANGKTKRREINSLDVQTDKLIEPSHSVLNEAENLKPDEGIKRSNYHRIKFDSSRVNNYESVKGMDPNEESPGSTFFTKIIRPIFSLFSALHHFIRPVN